MKITQDEVLHAARLARLKLGLAEVEKFQNELDSILEYMDMLSKVETGDIEPMSRSFHVTNVFREDEAVRSQDRAEALLNAPCHKDGVVVVPKVIE